MIIHYIRRKLEEEYHNLSLWYFASFIFGIIFFFQISYILPWYFSCIVLTSILIVIYFAKRDIILFFSAICFGMFLFGYSVISFRVSSVKINFIEISKIVTISGDIDSIKPTLHGYQITIKNIVSDEINGLNKARVNISKKISTNFFEGDRIRLKVRLFPLTGSVLPGTFDFGFYLYMSGIEATGYALTEPETIPKIIGESDRDQKNSYVSMGLGVISSLQRKTSSFVSNWRSKIYKRLIDVMGDETGNFTAAILIGETKAIPKTIAQNMRNTGIAHILSVSGLHLSLVAMIFFTFSRMLLNCSNFIAYNTNVKVIAACISIIGSFGYLLVSGSNIAATRAFIMTMVFIIAVILGRSAYPLRSVMVAAFIILFFLPEYVLHPSFQLSFTAVLCLISGYELYIKYKFFSNTSTGVFSSIKLYVFANIYTSFLASVVTAPYVIYHFYKFATYSEVMNLIAVPLMSFFMMPLALISLFLMPIDFDAYILKLLSFFVSLVIKSADFIVHLPWSVLYVGFITPASLVIFTFGFFWVSFWQTKWRFYGFLIILISQLLTLITPKPDLIYDHNVKIIGVKNGDGKLELYSQNHIPNFTYDYWVNWYGQKDGNVHYSDELDMSNVFTTYDRRNVEFKYTGYKDDVSLIITSKSHARQIVSSSEIRKYRQVLLFCSKQDRCRVEFGKEKFWYNYNKL